MFNTRCWPADFFLTMATNLLVLSDLHLSRASVERNALFLRFLESALQEKEEVLIVGDLFELWLGWDHLTFEYQKPILEGMRDLAASGLILDYVEGNRDFGIRRYQGTIFRNVSNFALEREWGRFRLYVEHGDLINQSDKAYRVWRTLSKNRFSFFLLEHLPSSLLLNLTSGIERKLRATNLKYKTLYPEELCRNFYTTHFRLGMDIVIVGHFHCEKEVSMTVENRNVLFYNLPGWEQGFRFLVIPQETEKPHFENWEGKRWKYFNGVQAGL